MPLRRKVFRRVKAYRYARGCVALSLLAVVLLGARFQVDPSLSIWAQVVGIAAAALALLAAGAFGWRAGYAPRFMAASVDAKLAAAPHLSIVVLPFENLSGDKEQDYFADGITEDLTTDL